MNRKLDPQPVMLWIALAIGLSLLAGGMIARPPSQVSANRSMDQLARPGLAQTHLLPRPVAPAGVTPTTQWVNFRSQNTTVMGAPVAVGAVVRAFDPDGVQCGEFVVDHDGWYGIMPCYADDPNTPGDEGARANDPIHFTIDGLPALAMGPDVAIWTANGDLRVVDLAVIAVTSTATPSVTPTPTTTPPGTIPAPTATPQFTLYLPIIRM